MGKNQPIEMKWEIWHQDNFDPDTPRQVIFTGEEIIDGLVKLWICHLHESIQLDGFLGFSKINLWLKTTNRSIEVVGDYTGQKKLRKWLFGDDISGISSSEDAVDQNLLGIIIKTHLLLLERGKTSKIIIEQARISENKYEFMKLMENLYKS